MLNVKQIKITKCKNAETRTFEESHCVQEFNFSLSLHYTYVDVANPSTMERI